MEGIVIWLEEMVLVSGPWAPLFYVLLIIFGIAFSPLPITPLMVFAGRVFGVVDAFFWSMLGIILGTLIAFYIGRLLGRRAILYFVPEEKIKKVEEKLSEERMTFSIFALHLLPLPFLDVVSFVAGLTHIRVKNFLLAVTFGYLPSVLLFVYFGNRIENIGLTVAIIAITVVLFAAFYEAYSEKKRGRGIFKRVGQIFSKD